MDDAPPPPTVTYLFGFPGVGKYTVACRLAERTGARVVDNHYVNNPIFGLIDADGVTPLPDAVWERVGEVRRAVLETVATLSPRAWSFVFTNVLLAGHPDDEGAVPQLEELARRRGSRFVPVRLLCDPDELARRVALPGRRERMKATDANALRALVAAHEVLDPDHPHLLTLDTTDLPPDEAARRVAAHAAALRP